MTGWRIYSIFNTKNTSTKDQMVTMHNLKLTNYMENQSQPKFLGCSLNLPSLVFNLQWRKVLKKKNHTSKQYNRNTIVQMCYSQYPRTTVPINLFNDTTKYENIYGIRSRKVTTFKYWKIIITLQLQQPAWTNVALSVIMCKKMRLCIVKFELKS